MKRLLNGILNSFIIRMYVRSYRLLTASQRKKGFFLVVLTVLGAVMEVAGVAALVPLTLAATNPKWVGESNLMQSMYNGLGFKDNASFMVFLSVGLLTIFVLKTLIAIYLYHYQSRFAFGVGTDLSRRMFIKFYNRGYTFFKNTPSGEIHNKIFNIPIFFSSSILVSLINFFSEALVMFFIIIGIAATNINLFFALVLLLVPAAVGIYNLTKTKLYEMGLRQAVMYDQVFAKLQQSIYGYQDVRINNKERVFLDNYIAEMRQLNRLQQVRWVITLIPQRALEVIFVMGITITFVYTFAIAKDPSQLYGFIAVFATAAFRVLPSFNRLLQAVMGMRSHQYSLDILEDGDLPQELTMTEVRPLAFERDIVLKDLSFSFDPSLDRALKGINLTFKKGEKIGIIGESGSGKTTLMNILLRFLEEEDGGVYVDGHKLSADDKASWRAIVGYVKQDVYLIDATLQENVAFGDAIQDIDPNRLADALEQASLSKWVESLPDGINTKVGEQGSKVSGGQKQRIGIARALYSKAQVLVFDEATSALDTETEQAITESIEQIDGGQTIFVIAHRISTLRFCDRIVEMKDGEVVGIHSFEEIMARELARGAANDR